MAYNNGSILAASGSIGGDSNSERNFGGTIGSDSASGSSNGGPIYYLGIVGDSSKVCSVILSNDIIGGEGHLVGDIGCGAGRVGDGDSTRVSLARGKRNILTSG